MLENGLNGQIIHVSLTNLQLQLRSKYMGFAHSAQAWIKKSRLRNQIYQPSVQQGGDKHF